MITTLDTGCLPLGFVIVIHLFLYLVIVWIVSVKSIPHLSHVLSGKPLIFLFGKHSLGYSQSYHKMTVVWVGFPISSPSQTQLSSTTTCQLIALLFLTMPQSIKYSTDWSKQIWVPLKGYFPRLVSEIYSDLRRPFHGSLQQTSKPALYLSPTHTTSS